MGNGNSHLGGDRRNKAGGGFLAQDAGLTIGDFRWPQNREMSPFDHGPPLSHAGGPFDIRTTSSTKRGSGSINNNNNFKTASGAHRPRATTESGPRRQISTESSASKAADKKFRRKLPTIFKYQGPGKEVFVCGTFNGWKKLPMVRSQKDFVAIVELQEGDHEYKFMVDGNWVNDSGAPVVEDPAGNKNNKIHVQKEDFDAYDALDMDSAAVLKLQSKKNQQFGQEFSQEIPQSNVFEHRSGPPILPPQLLQVILNKDTPLSCEPTLLPEPNHVMINHLYALSIKDGVMVLSSTRRYRKKYVTTLLYKPMGVRKQDSN